jgi:hypothetical protein
MRYTKALKELGPNQDKMREYCIRNMGGVLSALCWPNTCQATTRGEEGGVRR